MKHCGTQRIETKRLVLRKFSVDDAEAMFRNWASDPEVTKYLTWPAHANIEVSRALLQDWVSAYSQKNYYQWAIVLKEQGDEPIGSISAVEWNDDIAMAEIGYCIGRAWWRRGITSEALQAVMDFFFDQVEANRIQCRHDPRNPHSGMVMKKCGMKYEGTMRSSDKNNQGVCDACCYHSKSAGFTRRFTANPVGVSPNLGRFLWIHRICSASACTCRKTWSGRLIA